MGDHKLDIAKTIAERIAREKEKEREKELGLSEDTSQSLSLQLSGLVISEHIKIPCLYNNVFGNIRFHFLL